MNAMFTSQELKLWRIFKDNEGKALSHEFFSCVPPYESKGNLRLGILYVRKKMLLLDPKGRISTIRGYGYKYEKLPDMRKSR